MTAVIVISFLVLAAGLLGGVWEWADTRREREREREAQHRPKHALQQHPQFRVRLPVTIQSDTFTSLPRVLTVGSAGRAA